MAGNVWAPINLRYIIGLYHRLYPNDVAAKFILEHPRKCSTMVFSSRITHQLNFWAIVFTTFQFVVFLAYDFNKDFVKHYDASTRVLIAYFMAVSTRTGGFCTLSGVFQVAPCLQVVYAIMMYIPCTPVAFILKPRSVGGNDDELQAVDGEDPVHFDLLKDGKRASERPDFDEHVIEAPSETPDNHVPSFAVQIYRQLWDLFGQELPFLTSCLVLICMIDSNTLESPESPRWLDIWGVIFEICAAWGTAGLTLASGALCLAYSLHPVSRFIFTIIMLKARQRVPVDVNPVVDLRVPLTYQRALRAAQVDDEDPGTSRSSSYWNEEATGASRSSSLELSPFSDDNRTARVSRSDSEAKL